MKRLRLPITVLSKLFPDAQKAGAARDLKMIYGSELYVVGRKS